MPRVTKPKEKPDQEKRLREYNNFMIDRKIFYVENGQVYISQKASFEDVQRANAEWKAKK